MADAAADRASNAASALENMDGTAQTLAPDASATLVVSTVDGHYHLDLGVPQGIRGETGENASIAATVVSYQNSLEGTTVPTGAWLDQQPATPQGQYLWTRTTLTWNNGQTTVLYSVTYMGLDGGGAVASVNTIAPDANGNVTLPTDTTPTTNSENYVTSGGVKTELDALSARIGSMEHPAQVWTDVSFTIPQSSWSLVNGRYTTTVQSASILATSGVFVNYDDLDNAVTPIIAEEGTGQVTFTTEAAPTGIITGTFRIVDSVNGIVPMNRGGTGVAATSNDNLLTQLGAASITALTTGLAGKQDTLTFDTTPTSGSTNPVTSGGVYAKIGQVGGTSLQEQITNDNGKITAISSYTDPPSRADFNSLTETKRYVIGNIALYGHNPGTGFGFSGTLDVDRISNNYIRQVLRLNKGSVYRFSYDNASTWTGWLCDSGVQYAIVAYIDTAPQAITSGQYVIWNGSLYTATTNIPSGGTLSTSNLQAVPNGGLNAIADQLRISRRTGGAALITAGHTLNNAVLTRVGSQIVLTANITATSDIAPWRNFAFLPNDLYPPNPTRGYAVSSDESLIPIYVGVNGNLQVIKGTITSGNYIMLNVTYNL